MNGLTALFLFVVCIAALITRHQLQRRERAKRRGKLMSREFPKEWQKHLLSNVSLFAQLPDDLTRQVEGHTQILLNEKVFEMI